MLEQMREQTGSLIIWVLFAIIIAAFVLFFGSPSDQLGCGSTNEYAIEVNDEPVSVHSWRFTYNGIPMAYGRVGGDARKPLALEFLLQREILAQEAEKLDMHISTDVINKALPAGDFFMLSSKLDGTKFYFTNEEGQPSYFEYKYLQNLAGRLGLPNVGRLKKEQRREMMAYLMKQEIIRSAYVSKEEARTAFIQNNTKVSASYVKFDVAKYRAALKLTEAQISEYAASHEEDLKSEWEQVKPRWESDKARVKARIIKVARAASPSAEAPKAKDEESGEEGEAPAEAVEAAPDAGRVAIDAAKEELLGGASFAEVAARVSEDRTASYGGQIGWRSADSLGYGQEVVDGTKDLEVGTVSDVIETPSHYYLVLIEEKKDKGLTFEEKKFDLAVKAAPASVALDLAKRDAEAALAQAQTTALGELFPAPALDLKNLTPEDLGNLSPEEIQQLINQSGGKNGAIVSDGPTEYAQVGGETTASEPPATPAPAKPAAAKPAAAAKTAATAEATEAPATIATVADGVARPGLQTITGTTRNGDFIAGVGRSEELASDLFSTLGIGDLGTKVYKVSDSEGFVIVQLTDREEADMTKFAEEEAQLRTILAQEKGGRRLQDWVLKRCLALKKSGAIKTNPAMLQSGDNKRIPYEPCSILARAE